jgi:hypothetical protein
LKTYRNTTATKTNPVISANRKAVRPFSTLARAVFQNSMAISQGMLKGVDSHVHPPADEFGPDYFMSWIFL